MGSHTGTPEFQPGQTVGGYTIEAFIASGGTGNVYRATKEILERTAAVKILRPDFVERKDTLGRFLREARLASRLEHPGIVRVYDVGEEDGRYYIVMEYVEGRDLWSIVRETGRLPVGETLRVGRQIAEALAYAHERGIVHRDIKPGNVLLTTTGEVKVADLGLARPKHDQDTALTQAGHILGTPAFMSPEQCRGLDVDARSDLYSLGATLYNLLSGKLPFRKNTMAAVIHQVVNDNPPALDILVPDLPPAVVAVVQRLMAKHPGARYQTAKEVVSAIDEIRLGRFVFARETVQTASPPLFPAIRWRRIGALTLVGTTLGIAVHFLWPHLTTDASSGKGSDSGIEERVEPRTSFRSVRIGSPSIALPEGEDDLSESTGSGIDSSSAPSRQAATDPALTNAARELQQCIATGALDDALQYVESSLRSDRQVQFALTQIADHIDANDLRPGSCLMQQSGPDAGSGLLMFNAPEERPVALPVEWVRQDGEWYVRRFFGGKAEERGRRRRDGPARARQRGSRLQKFLRSLRDAASEGE